MIQQREVGQNHHWKTCFIYLMLTFSLGEFGHTTSAKQGDIPLASSPSGENIQRGKALYEGLARCVHCHGSAALRRPLTATELFLVIKFGVSGTSHIPYRHLLSDEEIWAIVEYQLHASA
jgi:mono/diheme cytochrome c family protein